MQNTEYRIYSLLESALESLAGCGSSAVESGLVISESYSH